MSRSGPSPSSDLDPPKSAGHPSAARIASPGSNESSSTLISRKLPLFSILILVAVTALAMAAYSFSARKTNEAYVERQLMFASETLRMLLYSLVDGDLALMLKLADSDITRNYLRSPFDPLHEQAAMERFDSFARYLANGSLFWSSAADRRVWSMDEPPRKVPTNQPGFEWYDFTLESGQPYYIDVGASQHTGRQTVWLNVPVLDNGPDKKPLGLLGAAIELGLWLKQTDSAFERLDPNLGWLLCDSNGQIITSADASLSGLKHSIMTELPDVRPELTEAIKGLAPGGPFQKGQNVYQISFIPNFNWLLVVQYELPDFFALNLPFNIMFFSMFFIFFIIIFSFNIFIRKADSELAAGRLSLLLANREAEKASRAKSAMLAIVSHELRTPLNAIIGVSRLILREDTSKTVREHAANVKQAGDSAMALITDLLDLSKLEAGRFEIACQPYWLGSLVQDVVNIIRLRLSDTGLSLVVKIEPSLPSRLSGDEIRLRRILLNLMSNAVKYTHEGHVSLSLRRGSGRAGAISDGEITSSERNLPLDSPEENLTGSYYSQRLSGQNPAAKSSASGAPASSEVASSELGSGEISSGELGSGEISSGELGSSELSSIELSPDELGSGELNSSGPASSFEPFSSSDQQGSRFGAQTALSGSSGPLQSESDEIGLAEAALAAPAKALPAKKALGPGQGESQAAHDGPLREGQVIQLVMEVADSGVGIKEGDLSELFTSFARFDREINQDVEGSGLGLSITKGLIDAMGGQIAVSSIYGVGSVFTVTIPQTVVSKAPVGDGLIQDFAADQSDLSVHFVAPEAKILIVDDIRTNLKVSRGLLAAYEAQIDLCDQAREAAGLVEKGGYDLVFLDHMMPFMTGVEVAAKIRAMDGPAGKTPLIALTGDAAPEMAKMFLEKGFNDVLAKPVDLARLGEVMDRWIPKSLRHDPASRGKSKESGLAGPVPEGLNVREGLTRSGSKPGFYLEALACFRSDALERLETLSQKPDAENLPTIAGQLHALKAAAGGVGANLLAAKASALDAAAKKGDLPLVQKALPSFTEGLSKLLGELSSFISVNASKLADPDATMDPQTLKRLIEALDNEDIKKIDELLDAMPRAGADTPMGALLSDVSEAVLRLELPKAADLVKAYLAIHFPEAQAAGQAEASADPLAAR